MLIMCRLFSLRIPIRPHDFMISIGEDPLVLAALEADLGLPPGTFKDKDPKSFPDPGPDIRAYISAIDPTAEQLKTTFEAIRRYFKFWTDLFEAAQTEDPSIVANELLYRLRRSRTARRSEVERTWAY